MWSSGATARAGSLGAPLFDAAKQQVVGVLVAGTSSCAAGAAGRPDYFGRLSAVRTRRSGRPPASPACRVFARSLASKSWAVQQPACPAGLQVHSVGKPACYVHHRGARMGP